MSRAMGRLVGVGRLFGRAMGRASTPPTKQSLIGSNVIEVRGLSKTCGDRVVLDGIDIDVRRGEVFCLLGPNGAGKTMTLRLLFGLDKSSGGTVTVLGFDPASQHDQIERRVCLLSDSTGFQESRTGRETLRAVASKLELPSVEAEERVETALARVNLVEVANERVATYSRGLRQRLAVSEILVKRAEIVLLDEPAMGLDPVATEDLLQTIGELKRENVTVVMASHLLHQVQGLCDRMAFLKDGRIALMGTMAELAAMTPSVQHTLYVEAADTDVASAIRGIEGVQKVTRERGGGWRVMADRDVRAAAAKQIVSKGGALTQLSAPQPDLREIYARYFQAESGSS